MEREAVIVVRPLNGFAKLVIFVDLHGQDVPVGQRPLLFIVVGKRCDGVHTLTSNDLVHIVGASPRVLNVVFLMLLEFERGEGKRTDDHHAPAHQENCRAPFVPHFSASFVKPMAAGAATN